MPWVIDQENWKHVTKDLRLPIRVDFQPGITEESGGGYHYTDGTRHVIAVDPDQTPAEVSRTMLHELCHAEQAEAREDFDEDEAVAAEKYDDYFRLIRYQGVA